MKTLAILLAAALFAAHGPAWAGDPSKTEEAELSTKSARVEILRARLATTYSPTASATLLEAENLLRQLRTSPANKRAALGAQLDAALVRLELEIDAASRDKR